MTYSPSAPSRQGMILLVVVSMLTLFAVVGLSFVLYAESSAKTAQAYRRAQDLDRPDTDPELLLKFFLGQFVYGTEDLHSALRGHSLAENMYGYNSTPGVSNTVPYSGVGRFRQVFPPTDPTVPPVLRGLDSFDLVNYTWFGNEGRDSFVRDPERYGFRRSPQDDPHLNPYICGSVSYTYPDAHTMFLGAADANGDVLARSFHRDWTSGDPNDPATRQGFGPLWVGGQPNPKWFDASHQGRTWRYQMLRPRPADHRGFPPPEDGGGDVKNLIGSKGTIIPGTNPRQYWNNDSVWIDLNFPVQTTPDGKKYKPLFAAFVEDLDSRVNVNVHGNIRGAEGGGGINWQRGEAGGHQAWGPWEVNLQHVLTHREGGTGNPYEARRIFIGNGITPGRYDLHRAQPAPPSGHWGNDGYRSARTRLPFGPFYSLTNADANPFDAADAIRQPGVGGWPTTQPFPGYSGAYANGEFDSESRNNPVLFNFLDPSNTSYYHGGPLQVKDRVFAHSNVEALQRYTDTGSPALTSELFQLCPESFSRFPRARRNVTTIAFDVDRPGVVPSHYSNPAQASPYQMAPGTRAPQSPPQPQPAFPNAPGYGEFGQDWRAQSAELGRIFLNRPLPDYPGLTNSRIIDINSWRAARAARRELAADIYRCLVRVTGAYDPDKYIPPFARLPGDLELNALRWLAQLAVNIVDCIDKDDYLTAFDWGAVGTTEFYRDVFGGHPERAWVFGTELPRLVVNEAYAEIINDPRDLSSSGQPQHPYLVRFWVELHNPLTDDDPYLIERGNARLQVPDNGPGQPAYAAYQLVIAEGPNGPDLRLNYPDNVRGELRDASRIKTTVTAYNPGPNVPPVLDANELNIVRPTRVNNDTPRNGDEGGNQGFYVLGPLESFPGGENPRRFTTLRVVDNNSRESMVYERQHNDTDFANLRGHTLLLRRLACPHRPLDNQAARPDGQPNPDYNPFITVDYLDNLPTNDGVVLSPAGQRQPTVLTSRAAHGRRQPYAALQLQRQAAVNGQPRHTFFKVNSPRDEPFRWLVFHDRPLINPMELLDVSAYKPHELTQEFITSAGRFQHRAAPFFLDPRTRLHRLLEFLEGGEIIQGVTVNGRAIGKINLNTIWNREIFYALVNRTGNNRFPDGTPLNEVYSKMKALRTPDAQGIPGPNDRPFLGLATAHTTTSNALEATVLRAFDPIGAPTGRRLFEMNTGPADLNHPNHHPYYRFELLRKIMSNATTRSNVFAVHLTVGFFEVVDDSDKTRPPVLGPELGKAENRHFRHRMFSIVDRTNLTVRPQDVYSGAPYPHQPGPRPFFMNTDSAVTEPGNRAVTVPSTRGHYEDLAYQINFSNLLVIDTGPRQEVFTVTGFNRPNRTVSGNFRQRHGEGVPLSNVYFGGGPLPGNNYSRLTMLGNPGPQLRFDPRDPLFAGVVRYLSIVTH